MAVNNYDFIADIYDIYNHADYDIDFYLRRYQHFHGQAVELMAGTGRLAIPLIESGMNLDCVDVSCGLLDRLAQKLADRNLKSKIYHCDIRFFKPEKVYDLAIIGFNSLSEITDADDREIIFKSIYDNLSPNGEFVFSLYNPVYRRKYINNALTLVNEYKSGDSTILFFMTSKEDQNSVVDAAQFYEFYDAAGCLEKKRMLKLRFQLISKPEIEKLIEKTGFIIKEVFGNYDGSCFADETSPFMIYGLTK